MAEFTTRPVIMGTRGVVTSGHYLATAAGFRIMEQGGNAIDAAAAPSGLDGPFHFGITIQLQHLRRRIFKRSPSTGSG